MPPREYDFSQVQTGSEAFIGSLLSGMGAGYGAMRRVRTDRQSDEERERRMEQEDYAFDEWLRSIGRGGLPGATPPFNPNAPSAPQTPPGMDGAPDMAPPPIGAPEGSQSPPQGTVTPPPSGNPAGPIRRAIGSILSGGHQPYGARRSAPPRVGPSDAEARDAARYGHESGMQGARMEHDNAGREDSQAFEAEQRRLDREARMREAGISAGRQGRGDQIQQATLARQTANEIQSRMSDLKQIAFSRPQQLIPLHARSLGEAQALVSKAMDEYRALEVQYNQWMDTAQRLSASAVGVQLAQPDQQGAPRQVDPEAARRRLIAQYNDAIERGADPGKARQRLDEQIAALGGRPLVAGAPAPAPRAPAPPAALGRFY